MYRFPQNNQGNQESSVAPAPTEQTMGGGYFANNTQPGQPGQMQQPLPIPQVPFQGNPQGIPPGMPMNQSPQSHWNQANASVTGPYSAAMQMDRNVNATQDNHTAPAPTPYLANTQPPPLPQAQYSSPNRAGGVQPPAMGGVPNYGAVAAPPMQQAPMQQAPMQQAPMQQAPMQQAPQYYDMQQQQQQPQAYANNMYYQPQMPYGMPPNNQQFQPQQPYMFPPQNMPQYYNPYQPPFYGAPQNPYWQPPPIDGDPNYPRHPQNASAHGNVESFRYIRQINNNDVLCGRGGATNSHIGNRSFRSLVKEYKDKYLRAKKKEKPAVAGEIVDKIRSLDPPGRFLKKDRDSGYWLDIGDIRAKEKTSQALREGAPAIRKQMEFETEEKKSVALDSNADDSERKTGTLPVPSLPVEDVKQESGEVDETSPPAPKRLKVEETVESNKDAVNSTDKKDDDNASNVTGEKPVPVAEVNEDGDAATTDSKEQN